MQWLWGVMVALVLADEHIVLRPDKTQSTLPEKMLVFIPGGKVPNDKYIPTATAIQRDAAELNLWVVIPAVFQRLCIISCSATSICSPLHSAVETALAEAVSKGWKRGNDDEDLWIAGHSLGGVCANTLFQAYDGKKQPYAGMIVMGSYVDESGSYDLTHYPKPVLTLNVELDGGLARPGKTAVWWRQFVNMEKSMGKELALKEKPVIVIKKLNHSDFCPGFDVPGDLPAEVDQLTATATIGSLVAGFLHIQTAEVSQSAKDAAVKLLEEEVGWTRTLLTPYLKAQDMERSPTLTSMSSEGGSPFCATAQKIIANLKDISHLTVEDGYHVDSSNLEHCHPSWTKAEGGILKVATCSHCDYYADILNTGTITAASEIACKMLSSDRIAQQMNTTAQDGSVSCSVVNQHAVSVAEGIAAASTLERYKKQGRGWCFLPDVPTTGSIGPLWVFSDALTLKESDKCMEVTSPFLKTEVDGWIFPGSHYCKFLSPARVLDWMMTDSLKPASSATVVDIIV